MCFPHHSDLDTEGGLALLCVRGGGHHDDLALEEEVKLREGRPQLLLARPALLQQLPQLRVAALRLPQLDLKGIRSSYIFWGDQVTTGMYIFC